MRRRELCFTKPTFGKDSLKKAIVNPIFETANVRANIAGQNHHISCLLSTPKTEKAAPVMGPTMNPIENAIPIRALF